MIIVATQTRRHPHLQPNRARGTVVYSSRRVRGTGFVFPVVFQRGLVDAANRLRRSGASIFPTREDGTDEGSSSRRTHAL